MPKGANLICHDESKISRLHIVLVVKPKKQDIKRQTMNKKRKGTRMAPHLILKLITFFLDNFDSLLFQIHKPTLLKCPPTNSNCRNQAD